MSSPSEIELMRAWHVVASLAREYQEALRAGKGDDTLTSLAIEWRAAHWEYGQALDAYFGAPGGAGEGVPHGHAT